MSFLYHLLRFVGLEGIGLLKTFCEKFFIHLYLPMYTIPIVNVTSRVKNENKILDMHRK